MDKAVDYDPKHEATGCTNELYYRNGSIPEDIRMSDGEYVRDTIEQCLQEAIAAERERCAKIAENWKSPLRPGTEARRLGHEEAAREIAAAIRINS